MSASKTGLPRLQLAGAIVTALCWTLAAAGVSSRAHLVMGCLTIATAEPALEPLLASSLGSIFVCVVGLLWVWLVVTVMRGSQGSSTTVARKAVFYLGCACLPIALSVQRMVSDSAIPALYWEPLWIAGWTGLSFATLVEHLPTARWESWLQSGWAAGGVLGLTLGVGTFFLSETQWYYQHYLLGFNDFGHFAQRVANTASGRGFLLESPVLPVFWDHFNPGLALLAPIWKLMPSVTMLFWLQAGCLAGSALIVWRLALRLGQSQLAAIAWSAAWLAQPALGQMNLAYTYGWHPISLAIPLLLASLLCVQGRRWGWAIFLAVWAMSMEEGVVVVVSLTSLAYAGVGWFAKSRPESTLVSAPVLGLSSRVWLITGLVTAIAFVLIYQFSGLAEFQTGRFVALGDNLHQVILSPLLRPAAFWGELLQPAKAGYVLALVLPCYILSLGRGWFLTLGTWLPMLVLLVWDHQPAACLAFHYASCLLPFLWLASMWGAASTRNSAGAACGALATGLVLSLFIGQLPYSSPTLLGVISQTYGMDHTTSRGPSTELGPWLDEHVAMLRADGAEVLATGRIAAHLVGNRDIETVGQYLYRRDQLSELADREGQPIVHYQWIILDRDELLQQSQDQIIQVAVEAEQHGFEVFAERESVILLRNALKNASAPSPPAD